MMDAVIANKPLTISELKEKLDSLNWVSHIEDSEENSFYVVIDSNYIYEITQTEDGKFDITGGGKDNGEPWPTISLEQLPTQGTAGEKIQIKVVASVKETSKTKKVEKVINQTTKEEKEYVSGGIIFEVEQNGTYEFEAVADNGKTRKAKIIVNIESGEIIKISAQPTTPRNTVKTEMQNGVETGPIKVSITFGNINLSNNDKYQYKIGKDGTWQTSAEKNVEVDVTENVPIVAKYYDGKNSIGVQNYSIQNVDNIAPNSFTATATSTANSITLSGTTTDAVSTGYAGDTTLTYKYSKDGSSWQDSNIITEVSSGTYNAKIKAIDKAGNETIAEVSIATKAGVAAIGTIQYDTLQNAIDAVPTNNTQKTINMLKDITESNIKIIEGQNIKLNIKQKTITGRIWNEGTIDIENGTINNPSQHALYNYGTINLSSVTISSNNDSVATITNRGILNVKENTTITSTVQNCIYTAKTTNIYGETTNIYGGTIYSTEGNTLNGDNATYNIYEGTIYSTAKSAITPTKSSVINIYGGTIYATNGNGLNVANTVKATVEGGNLYSTGNGHGIWVASGGDALIKGGTIQCKNTISQEALDIDSGGTATVQGGTIEHLDGGKAIICDGTIEINGSSVLIQNSSSGTTYPTIRVGSGATCTFKKGTIKNNTSGGCCYYDVNDTTTQKTGTWTK